MADDEDCMLLALAEHFFRRKTYNNNLEKDVFWLYLINANRESQGDYDNLTL